MSKEVLTKAGEDVVQLLSEQLEQLKNKPADRWTINESRMLEVYNKILTVCLDREKNIPSKGAYANSSEDELMAAFE